MGLSPAATALALRVGMTGAAFVGAVGAVLLTLVLARGVEQTLRLLLAGVVVGVVLGSGSALRTLMNPDIMRAMQAFMLGSTGYVGWSAVQIMATALVLCMLVALGCSRMLDALSLGEATARSLGVRLPLVRLLLIATLALATGAAVAQCGLVAFVGPTWCAAGAPSRTAACCCWPRWPGACCCWRPTSARAGSSRRRSCRWASSRPCWAAATCCT
jgi:iron complex transport system permease protein